MINQKERNEYREREGGRERERVGEGERQRERESEGSSEKGRKRQIEMHGQRETEHIKIDEREINHYRQAGVQEQRHSDKQTDTQTD